MYTHTCTRARMHAHTRTHAHTHTHIKRQNNRSGAYGRVGQEALLSENRYSYLQTYYFEVPINRRVIVVWLNAKALVTTDNTNSM